MSRRLQGHRGDQELSDRDLAAVSGRLAANVRRLRLAAGWSQERLAERAGIETSYLQKVERQAANITLRALGALARALVVDVDALLAAARPALRPNGRPSRAKAPHARTKARPKRAR